MARHAEVAGGGVAGLIAATALAQRGWTVRVHERAADIRNYGAGISCWYNFCRVLKAIGVYEEAFSYGRTGGIRETWNENGQNLWSLKPPLSYELTIKLSRGDLLTALANAAKRAGVDIVTSSKAVGARAGGVLLCEDGTEYPADLVVAADGVHSQVRDSLKLLRQRKHLGETSMRVLVPRIEADKDSDLLDKSVEYWSGQRRMFHSYMNEDWLYLSFTAMTGDTAAVGLPLPVEEWTKSFPLQADFIKRVGEAGRWDDIQQISLHSWSKGKVAVVGDAAHGMSPNIGQGGGCASMNALSLAVYASREGDIEYDLQDWERHERPMTDFSQRVSAAYSKFIHLPPWLRWRAMKMAGSWKWLVGLRQRPALHIPTGYEAST